MYEHGVDSLIASLPASERHLPQNVARVFSRVEQEQINRWVARNLVQDLKGPLGGLPWHFNFVLWEAMVGIRLSHNERLSLFAHYLPYEGGHGLEQASRFYFGVAPHKLSSDQVFGLLAVSRGPRRFSPHRDPDSYREEVERLRQKYGSV